MLLRIQPALSTNAYHGGYWRLSDKGRPLLAETGRSELLRVRCCCQDKQGVLLGALRPCRELDQGVGNGRGRPFQARARKMGMNIAGDELAIRSSR